MIYTRPKPGLNEPEAIMLDLTIRCDEFFDLKEWSPSIVILMRDEAVVQGGRMVLGAVHLPCVQGKLNSLFQWMLRLVSEVDDPDFVMILDNVFWESATAKEREILIFHELCHIELKRDKDGDVMLDDDTGRAKWKLRGHDVEEFSRVVERYGAYSEDLRQFKAALDKGCEGFAG